MRALLYLGNKESTIKDFPDPCPGPGQVVVEMKASGICGSDIHFFRTDRDTFNAHPRRNMILGHEPAGVVREVGPGVTHVAPGDRVLVYHYTGCYHCGHCSAGFIYRCEQAQGHGREIHGGFADCLLTEAGSVVQLPDWASFAEGAIAACAGGTGFNAALKAEPSGKDLMLVFGLGPVGLSAALVSQALGAQVVGVEPKHTRRELAADLGIELLIDPKVGDLAAELHRLTGQTQATLAIESSGQKTVQEQIHVLLEPGSTAILLGIGHWQPTFVAWHLIRNEITLRASKIFPIQVVHQLFQFLERQNLSLDRMVTHRYPLAEAQPALLAAEQADSGKALIEW
jgi:threonine dehydrogenase-like Zn-dependent dehydrogenase